MRVMDAIERKEDDNMFVEKRGLLYLILYVCMYVSVRFLLINPLNIR